MGGRRGAAGRGVCAGGGERAARGAPRPVASQAGLPFLELGVTPRSAGTPAERGAPRTSVADDGRPVPRAAVRSLPPQSEGVRRWVCTG